MGVLVLERYLVDLVSLNQSATLDGAGAASLRMGQVPPGVYWEVERFDYSGAGAAATLVQVFATQAGPFQLRDLATGAQGINDEASPVRFWPNESIIVTFTGGTAANVVAAYMQVVSVLYLQVELPDPPGGKRLLNVPTSESAAAEGDRSTDNEAVPNWN